MEKRTYRAGELCRRFDISKPTLYRWEAEGRLSPVPRDWRNWRVYTDVHVRELTDLLSGQGRIPFEDPATGKRGGEGPESPEARKD